MLNYVSLSTNIVWYYSTILIYTIDYIYIYNILYYAVLLPMAWLLLEHVKYKLALHGVLDKLLLADVSISLLIHGVPADQPTQPVVGGARTDLMSETQTVTRSSSSSMPASRNRPITMSRISSTSMVPPPSVSKAVKIQLSLSSGVLSFVTLFALTFYRLSEQVLQYYSTYNLSIKFTCKNS